MMEKTGRRVDGVILNCMYRTIFFTLFFSFLIQSQTPTEHKQAHPHSFRLSPLRGLAQAAWLQAEYDWWKAQSTESCELRAWINIRWARRRHKERGREVGIDCTSPIPSPPATAAAAAAVCGPSSSSVDKTELSLEEELGKACLRKWEELRTLKIFFFKV